MPVYQHYKNKHLYDTLSLDAKLEATLERMVVYRCRESGQVWVRPSAEFHQLVEHEGKAVKRFKLVSEQDKDAMEELGW